MKFTNRRWFFTFNEKITLCLILLHIIYFKAFKPGVLNQFGNIS